MDQQLYFKWIEYYYKYPKEEENKKSTTNENKKRTTKKSKKRSRFNIAGIFSCFSCHSSESFANDELPPIPQEEPTEDEKKISRKPEKMIKYDSIQKKNIKNWLEISENLNEHEMLFCFTIPIQKDLSSLENLESIDPEKIIECIEIKEIKRFLKQNNKSKSQDYSENKKQKDRKSLNINMLSPRSRFRETLIKNQEKYFMFNTEKNHVIVIQNEQKILSINGLVTVEELLKDLKHEKKIELLGYDALKNKLFKDRIVFHSFGFKNRHDQFYKINIEDNMDQQKENDRLILVSEFFIYDDVVIH